MNAQISRLALIGLALIGALILGTTYWQAWASAGLVPAVSSVLATRLAVSTPSLLVAVSRRNTCRAAACWAGVRPS